MSVTINAPKTPVTEGSKGVATATMPNVCKMPGPPAPFVPTPLPNIGKSGSSPKDYSKDVEIEKKKVAIQGATFKSMGDVASKGTGGGIVSSNTEGPTRFVGPGSTNVKIEGKRVQFLSDPMLNNCGPSGSPPNSATMVGLMQASGLAALVGDEICPLCGNAHGDAGKLEETEDTKGDSDKLKEAADRAAKRPNANPLPKMLGVVRCMDKKVYASNSGYCWADLSGEMPKEWHALNATIRDRPRRFQDHIRKANQDAFQKAWDRTVHQNNTFNLSKKKNPKMEPFYPPGSCAAQQAILLCLDHGGRPAGLTERWYNCNDSEASVLVYYRRTHRSEAKPGRFGGTSAVPPCGTCQVILTALMCPDELAPKCVHMKPPKGTCKIC